MNTRREIPMRHFYEEEINVYDLRIADLGAGAPGPDLLVECCDTFQAATDHRMVRFCCFVFTKHDT